MGRKSVAELFVDTKKPALSRLAPKLISPAGWLFVLVAAAPATCT
jgi:hypothetical protein